MMLNKLIAKLKEFILTLPNKITFTIKKSWMLVLVVYTLGLFAQFLVSPEYLVKTGISFESLLTFFNYMVTMFFLPVVLLIKNKYTYFLADLMVSSYKYINEQYRNIFYPKTEMQKKYELAVEMVKAEAKEKDRIFNESRVEKQKVYAEFFARQKAENEKMLADFCAEAKKNQTTPTPNFLKKSPIPNNNIDLIIKSVKSKITKIINEILGIFDTSALSQGQSYASDFVLPSSSEARAIFELYHSVNLLLLSIALILVVLAALASVEFIKKMLGKDVVFDNSIEIARQKKIKRLLFVKNIKWNETKTLGEQFAFINFICDFNNFNKYLSTNSGSVFWVYYSRLEFVWTLMPCIVLLFISLPSFTLALALDEAHKPTDWIKVVGNQWFWVYEYSAYVDNSVVFSNIVQGGELNERALRVLAVDNCVTLKQNKFSRLLITSADVIHSWCVPALGIKVDACPGRINAVTVLPGRCGVYYGQCSEICGVNHGFMPICVEVVM